MLPSRETNMEPHTSLALRTVAFVRTVFGVSCGVWVFRSSGFGLQTAVTAWRMVLTSVDFGVRFVSRNLSNPCRHQNN